MKLDQDLFRNILLLIESYEANTIRNGEEFISGYKDKYGIAQKAGIVRHVQLTVEAGFVMAEYTELIDGTIELDYVSRLTYEGHQFLIKVRSEATWNNIRQTLKKEGLEGSIDLAKKLSEQYIQNKLGI